MTELHIAAYEGDLEWVRNCLRGGLSVHTRDAAGYTPMHWVADMGLLGEPGEREAIVDALAEAGADINAHDGSERTVLEIARLAEADSIVKRLLELAAVNE